MLDRTRPRQSKTCTAWRGHSKQSDTWMLLLSFSATLCSIPVLVVTLYSSGSRPSSNIGLDEVSEDPTQVPCKVVECRCPSVMTGTIEPFSGSKLVAATFKSLTYIARGIRCEFGLGSLRQYERYSKINGVLSIHLLAASGSSALSQNVGLASLRMSVGNCIILEVSLSLACMGFVLSGLVVRSPPYGGMINKIANYEARTPITSLLPCGPILVTYNVATNKTSHREG